MQLQIGHSALREWPVQDLDLALGVQGSAVGLSGGQVVLAPHDRFGFNSAIETAKEASGRKKSRRARKQAERANKVQKPSQTAVQPPQPTPVAATQPHPTEDVPASKPSRAERKAEIQAAKQQEKVRAAEAKQASKNAKKAEKTRKSDEDGEAPAEFVPKPAPKIPGLADPDWDPLWEVHDNEGEGTSRSVLNSIKAVPTPWIIGVVGFLVFAYFFPTLASLLLALPGAAAVVVAGLALLDPAYTRFLPGSMSEVRLMTYGVGFFTASLLVSAVF